MPPDFLQQHQSTIGRLQIQPTRLMVFPLIRFLRRLLHQRINTVPALAPNENPPQQRPPAAEIEAANLMRSRVAGVSQRAPIQETISEAIECVLHSCD